LLSLGSETHAIKNYKFYQEEIKTDHIFGIGPSVEQEDWLITLWQR